VFVFFEGEFTMNRFWLVFAVAAGLLIASLDNSADAKRRLFRNRHRTVPVHTVQFWPWDNDDEVPAPSPDEPLPDPQPEPAPLPDDPEDLEDEVIDDDPAPEPAVPTDPVALNSHIAAQLGGYVRANHQRNGYDLDIYQARGRQRIVWVVASCEDWMSAVGKAAYLKNKVGASNGGLALVCDAPTPLPDPLPEPLPDPAPEPEPAPEPTPEPAPEDEVIPEPTPEPAPEDEVIPDLPEPEDEVLPEPDPNDYPVLYSCGGPDLCDAQAACEGSGLWLVVVHRDTGTVNRVIYNPQPGVRTRK
jgi:outer membrane biosynthesis protein TonB